MCPLTLCNTSKIQNWHTDETGVKNNVRLRLDRTTKRVMLGYDLRPTTKTEDALRGRRACMVKAAHANAVASGTYYSYYYWVFGTHPDGVRKLTLYMVRHLLFWYVVTVYILECTSNQNINKGFCCERSLFHFGMSKSGFLVYGRKKLEPEREQENIRLCKRHFSGSSLLSV